MPSESRQPWSAGGILIRSAVLALVTSVEVHAAAIGSRAPQAYTYSTVVSFGASYQDNGHSRSSAYQSTLKSSPYAGGRHCNGPVFVESLASSLGAKLIDYAYAGAQINNSLTYADMPATADQVQSYLADLKGGQVDRGTDRTLHVFWVGINPITQIWTDWQKDSDTNRAYSRIASNVESLLSQITALQTSSSVSSSHATKAPSGTDYLILPIPSMEIIPTFSFQTTPAPGDKNQLARLRDFSQRFDYQLVDWVLKLAKSDVPSRRTLTYDIVGTWYNFTNNPQKYGLTNARQACYDSSTGKVCSTPSTYMYWDTLHPTTSLGKKLADLIEPVVLGS